MNPLFLILLIGGGALYFSKLNETGKQLSITVLNSSSFKIGAGAVSFNLNVAVDNPTNTSVFIKPPNVKILFKGNEVGNTIPNKTPKKIVANDRTLLDPIKLQIPFSNLPSIVMSLFTKGTSSKIEFTIEIKTEANGIPITTTKVISL